MQNIYTVRDSKGLFQLPFIASCDEEAEYLLRQSFKDAPKETRFRLVGVSVYHLGNYDELPFGDCNPIVDTTMHKTSIDLLKIFDEVCADE